MPGLKLSMREVEDLQRKASNAASRARNIAAKAEDAIMTVVQSVEIGGAAFGFGLVQGRFQGVEVLGVPLDLGAGVVLHTLGFFVSGKASPHVHNIADGALASYFTSLGQGVGAKMLVASRGGSSSGVLPEGSGPGLSDAQLAAIAAQKAIGV